MTRPPLPEWAPHEAVWIGFPSDAELWLDDLEPAAARGRGVRRGGPRRGQGRGGPSGRRRMTAAADDARARWRPFAEVIVEPFGDIWLRDTGPIVLGSGKDRARARLPLQRLGRQI